MITQTMTTSFKAEILTGTHVLTTDVLKLALYTSSAALDATTTVYAMSNEVSGTGYSAGGATVSGAAVATSGTTAYVDFADVSWPVATFTARGALLYNSSKGNKSIAVLDFGADKTVAGGTFTVQWPASGASTAAVRIA